MRARVPIDQHAARIAPHFTVRQPEGPGPHPVVLQLHGCGGRQPLHDRYAEAAVAEGVASVVIDSFAPRRIPRAVAQATVCTGLRLRGAERSADVFAALHWLEAQPWADAHRVALAGWSHGGWTVMDALAGSHAACGLVDPQAHRLSRVNAAFLVYPYAGPPSLTIRSGWGDHRPRVSAVIAGRDTVVGKVAPLRALERLKTDGVEVETLVLPGATHSFDDPEARDPRSRYDAEHTAATQRLFARTLRPLGALRG